MDDTDATPIEPAVSDKPIRFKADGTPDMRGRSEGSRTNRFATGDGRSRPGRKKGSRDVKSDVLRIRDMPVSIRLPSGRTRKVSTREALLLRVRDRALQGDLKAIDMLERRFERYDEVEVEPDLTKALLAADVTILNSARARSLIPALPSPEQPSPPAPALPPPALTDSPN